MMFKTPTFDYCGFRAGVTTNPLLKSIVDQIQTTENIFRECPMKGGLDIKHLGVKDDTLFLIYSAGVYMTDVSLSNKEKDFLLMSIVYEIKAIRRFG